MTHRTLRRALIRTGDVLLALIVLVTVIGLAMAWPARFGGSSTFVFVAGPSMEPTLRNGDLVIARRRSGTEIGDLIVFRVPQPGTSNRLVVHRVIGGDSTNGFITQGDNNPTVDAYRPTGTDIVGTVWVHSHHGRWLLRAMRLTLSPLIWGVFTTCVAFWVSWQVLNRRDHRSPSSACHETGDRTP